MLKKDNFFSGVRMKWRGRRSWRNLPFLSICAFFCTASVIYFFRLMLLVEETPFHFLPDVSIQDFVVNTSGCQIPAWDPWDDSVKVFYEPVRQYKCNGQPSFLRVLPNAVVTLDETILRYYYEIDPQNVSCVFQEIIRNDSTIDTNTDNRFYLSKFQNLTFDKPLAKDFIKSVCSIKSKFDKERQTFHEFLPLTPLKTAVEYRSTNRKEKLISKPLNVIFLGLDSISRLNFLRHFRKCQKFIPTGSKLFNMKGYTKVADNTFPNLMPLLTGHFYQEFYNETYNKTMFFDDVEFSWKFFSDIGYRTLWVEDAPNIATFNYYRSGFKKPPTDYYFRPFALAVEESDVRKSSKSHCFGNKMEMQVIYDYYKSFIDTLGSDRPFFSFMFLARLTHDILNYAGYADEPTYRLLKYLDNSNILQNSLLIFYSDHGIRFGSIRKTYIGQFEERMPFMNLYVPNWFLEEYPEFERNLNINSKRLTTPFDIHATILHLASILSGNQKLKDIPKRGISLFQEVPSSRTCSDASIAQHWCTCQKIKVISKADFLVQRGAVSIIETINNMTGNHREKCAVLSQNEILSARILQIEHNISKNNSSESYQDYLLTVSAVPGNAIFEATVKCESVGSTCRIIDDISRINEYGKQSICVPDAVLRKFCYCV